jgi:ABC-type glycerol-3-phosphate transport system substrate-binding protein
MRIGTHPERNLKMHLKLIALLASATLLASCGQKEEERAAAVTAAEKANPPELVKIREEEFCENNTLKTRGIFSNDGGRTTIPMGIKNVQPRKRC